jgi:uncharacterized protein YbaP (TraB family)
MKKLTCIFTLILGLTQVIQSQNNVMKDENGILWKITGNGLKKPSYLFGTFHLGVKPSNKIIDSCTKFIKQVDQFYGEIDITEAGQNPQQIQQMGMLDEGIKLADLINEDDYKLLKNFMKDSVAMDESVYAQMKPMMVSILISIAYMSKMEGMDDINYSIDKELQQIASENKIEIKGFESVKNQGEIMFNKITPIDQADYLIESIKTNQFSKESIQSMIAFYNQGNLNEINKMTEQIMNTSFVDIFLTQRNEKWMQTIQPLLSENKKIFIAVGAGHLTGNKGLIKLLREKGYTVKSIL